MGDLKALRDDAQKQVTAKERELKNLQLKGSKRRLSFVRLHLILLNMQSAIP